MENMERNAGEKEDGAESKVFTWTGGAFVHGHFRLDDLVNEKTSDEISPEMAMYMKRYTDGSFSLRAITAYLYEMFGEDMLVTDTQHPSYVLDANYDNFEDEDKVQFFKESVREKTVDLLTQCIVERAKIIKEAKDLPHVLSGVEADILSNRGDLTVKNKGLEQLDFVTASFHSSIWHAAGHEKINKGANFIDMYHYVVENQNVDMLSHPGAYVPDDVKAKMSPEDWSELLQNMKGKSVAYEINLDSGNLFDNHGGTLDRKILLEALKIGTPLMIGFDFHYMADWGASPSPSLILDPNEAKELFQKHVADGSASKLLVKVLENLHALEDIGIQPHNILNASKDQFLQWLLERNSK
jgi:histidinol phosphatase-like PHP family hydrolase